MTHHQERSNFRLVTAIAILALPLSGSAVAQETGQGGQQMDPAKSRVIQHWTSDRRAKATPRDLVIDSRGRGYLRRADGTLQPHGHSIVAENASISPMPNARPSGGGQDTIPPSIANMNPGSGDQIGALHTFSATVTDNVDVRSVSFVVQYPDGSTTQTFSPGAGANDSWSINLSGFTDGNWSWWVVAKDTGKRGGNTSTSVPLSFTVVTGSNGGPGNGDTVTNAEWTGGGAVQTAAGRLYFEMPSNARRKGPWSGYVCSGTAVSDDTAGRSIILTAAHCVYDDVNKAYARNVLFVPNQAGTSASATDQNCNNDPLGCWVPSFGVVDTDWTTSTFPGNIPWDYAYYAVNDTGAHSGVASSASLESAAGTVSIDFTMPPNHDDGTAGASSNDFTHALGYSLNADPKFMHCAEDMTTEGADNWWLPSCGLSGGSSGGPWVQPMSNGDGPVISVNSWGYTGSPGMAGPKLHGSSAECVFDTAKNTAWAAVPSRDGDAGVAVNCP
jgi:hypothetical protein